MNLFLTGEFKQCKTGKRVLEDYLKNYNQFNQGLGLDFLQQGLSTGPIRTKRNYEIFFTLKRTEISELRKDI